MNTLVSIILIGSVILNIILGVVVRNFLIKEGKWVRAFDVQTNWMKLLSDEIKVGQQYLNELDERGVFQSDDEIGFFFDQMKKVQVEINKYIIPEEYGKEKAK